MKIGIKIELPGIRGANTLKHTLPDSDNNRQVKIYLVPESVSPDKYYISITPIGGREDVPPSRLRETLLLVDYTLSGDKTENINYVHKELKNA